MLFDPVYVGLVVGFLFGVSTQLAWHRTLRSFWRDRDMARLEAIVEMQAVISNLDEKLAKQKNCVFHGSKRVTYITCPSCAAKAAAGVPLPPRVGSGFGVLTGGTVTTGSIVTPGSICRGL
jgi:hypothetical protein